MPEGSNWIAALLLILLAALLAVLWLIALKRRRKGTQSLIDLPDELPDEPKAEREAEREAPVAQGEADAGEADDAEAGDGEEAPEELSWDTERDAQTWRELGWKLQDEGREEDAVRAFRCALDTLEEDQADSAWELHQEIGALYIQRQQLREAQQHAVAACTCAEMAFGNPSPQQAEALGALGALLEQMGNWNQARTQYQAALGVEQAVYGEASKEVGNTYSAIARMSERLTDRPAALKNYLLAYFIFVDAHGYASPDTESAKEDAERAYRAEDRDPALFEEWLEAWQPEE